MKHADNNTVSWLSIYIRIFLFIGRVNKRKVEFLRHKVLSVPLQVWFSIFFFFLKAQTKTQECDLFSNNQNPAL
jgi:hypothetical protein